MNVGDIDFCKLYYIHVDLISCFHLISFYNDYAAATPSDFIKCSSSHIAKMSYISHPFIIMHKIGPRCEFLLGYSEATNTQLCCDLHHFVSKLQLYNTILTLQHKSTIPRNYIRIHNTYNYNPNYMDIPLYQGNQAHSSPFRYHPWYHAREGKCRHQELH